MDREELRRQSAARRTGSAIIEAPQSLWQCTYCDRPFKGETSFMKHVCPARRRMDELQSPDGQAAYLYYADWMRAKKHSVPPIEKFADSKFFTTFLKFAQHVKKAHIPNPAVFIKVMVENGDVSPSIWCRDDVYSMYLKGYDASVAPERQWLESLTVLRELAADYEVPLQEIFKELPTDKLLDLIERRKLSHWFLLSSQVFRTFMLESGDREDDLKRALNMSAVITRVTEEKKLFRDLVKASEEVGL